MAMTAIAPPASALPCPSSCSPGALPVCPHPWAQLPLTKPGRAPLPLHTAEVRCPPGALDTVVSPRIVGTGPGKGADPRQHLPLLLVPRALGPDTRVTVMVTQLTEFPTGTETLRAWSLPSLGPSHRHPSPVSHWTPAYPHSSPLAIALFYFFPHAVLTGSGYRPHRSPCGQPGHQAGHLRPECAEGSFHWDRRQRAEEQCVPCTWGALSAPCCPPQACGVQRAVTCRLRELRVSRHTPHWPLAHQRSPGQAQRCPGEPPRLSAGAPRPPALRPGLAPPREINSIGNLKRAQTKK